MEGHREDRSGDDTPDQRTEWVVLHQHASELTELVSQVSSLSERLRSARSALADQAGGDKTEFSTRAAATGALAEAAAKLARCSDQLTVTSTQLALDAQVPLQEGCRSERLWLAQRSGINRHAAASIVRVGAIGERFPLVAAAFDEGRIHLGHVDAISTVIPGHFKGDQLATAIEMLRDLQVKLVTLAEETTVDEFAAFCRKIRIRLDADGPADRSSEASTVWLEATLDGRWMLSGDLSADDGALVATMLLERMEKLRNRLRNEAGDDPAFVMPTDRELRARALMELLLDGSGASRPGRVGVFLHIDLEDLDVDREDLDVILGGNAHTEADLDISDETLWGLLAGADITPVFNHEGSPLSYGRTRRLTPEILRHVLAHRDRRCRWPHCNQPALRTNSHHIEHWEDGGTTDPEVLAGLCRFHHLAHHNHGWGVTRGTDSSSPLRVLRPNGSPLVNRAAERRRLERDQVLARFADIIADVIPA